MADIHVSRFNGALVSKGLDRSESKHHYYVPPMANATIGSRAKMRENSRCRNGICCGSSTASLVAKMNMSAYGRTWPYTSVRLPCWASMPFTYRGRSLTVAAQQFWRVNHVLAVLRRRGGAGNPAGGRSSQRVKAG